MSTTIYVSTEKKGNYLSEYSSYLEIKVKEKSITICGLMSGLVSTSVLYSHTSR